MIAVSSLCPAVCWMKLSGRLPAPSLSPMTALMVLGSKSFKRRGTTIIVASDCFPETHHRRVQFFDPLAAASGY